MELTPEKIREVHDNAPPYQVESLMTHYIGQKVCWDLTYFGIHKQRDEKLRVTLLTNSSDLISCEIKEVDFPLIKLLPKNTPLRLNGKISEIGDISIDIEEAKLQEIRDGDNQIYFPQGSRENILAFLGGKILVASKIKIYDSYPSEEILKLLESSSTNTEIQLLGQNYESDFIKKIKAFNTYFNKNITARKTSTSHARFYIFDEEIFQVDSSFKNAGGNKATMINKLDKEAESVKQDFDKWWGGALVLI